MALSQNSFSTSSNVQFGSIHLPNVWVNSQTFTLPSINMAPPKVNGRAGAQVALAADVVEYDDLTVDIILDKQWKVWNDLYQHFLNGLNVEQGTFSKENIFDTWIEFFDGEGKSVKKFNFYKCRLLSFGDVSLTTMDGEDQLNTITLSFTFDYMEDTEISFAKQR